MKILITMLVLSFTMSNSNHKETFIRSNYELFKKSNYTSFDNFVGKWKWTNGKSTFLLVLEKGKYDMGNHELVDVVVGAYQYLKDGVAVTNTLSEIQSKPVITAGVLTNDSNQLSGTFFDGVTGRHGNIYFTYQTGNPAKLHVQLKKTEMIITKANTRTDFTIPNDFILQKVE